MARTRQKIKGPHRSPFRKININKKKKEKNMTTYSLSVRVYRHLDEELVMTY